jgi:hypothetical protein
MISLIHPSRSRPEIARKAADKWILKSGVKHLDYILCIDNDDPMFSEYIDTRHPHSFISNGDNRSAIDAINRGARACVMDIIVVMSDDFDCPDNWGQKLVESTQGKTDWIAKTPDGIQNWIITLPIMDRVYYQRFGYVYYPEYRHMFCDTEMTCVADLLQRKITLDIPFKHNHYSTGATKKDSVSERADSTWGQGEALFIERARKNFDLIDPPGKIMDEAYNNWIRRKL